MKSSRHSVVSCCAMLMIVLASLNWLGSASAQDVNPPVLEASPVIDQPVVADPADDMPVPTATTESNLTTNDAGEDVNSSDAGDPPVLYVTKVYCGDDTRIGDTEFAFNTAIAADALPPSGPTGTCTMIRDPDGAPVEVTLESTDPESLFPGMTQSVGPYWDEVEFSPLSPGEYQLTENDGADLAATSASFTVANGDIVHVTIINYVAALEVIPPVAGDGGASLDGYLSYCISLDRSGEVQFVTDNAMQVADTGTSQCQVANAEQGDIVLYSYGNGSVPTDDPLTTYSSSYRGDDGYYLFANADILPGWYQLGLYDGAFANQQFRSDIFPLQAYESPIYANASKIYVYEGNPPTALAELHLTKLYCGDDAREGSTEFVFDWGIAAEALPPSGPTDDCMIIRDPAEDSVDVTLSSTDPESLFPGMTKSVAPYWADVSYSPLPPGEYTLSEDDGTEPDAISTPFTLADGDDVNVTIINYVATLDVPAPVEGDGAVYLDGYLSYCTSSDMAGQVQFQIDNALEVADTGTSQCQVANAEQGDIVLYSYGNGAAPASEPVTTYGSPDRNDNGNYYFSSPDIKPGWYQLGFYDAAFANQQFRSDIFVLQTWESTYVNTSYIYAYEGEAPTALAELHLTKLYCGDDAREGSTEFIFDWGIAANALPPSGPTDNCMIIRDPAEIWVPVTLSATDPESPVPDMTQLVAPYWADLVTPLPPGEYTLTEDDGTDPDAVSAPFTLADGDSLTVRIINYVATPDDVPPPGEDNGSVGLDGYLSYCTSPVLAGQVQFQIDNALEVADTGNSECRVAGGEEGEIVLYFYGNDDAPSTDPVAIYTSPNRWDDGYYFFTSGDIRPGWYQLGFSDNVLATQQFRSDIFVLQSYDDDYDPSYTNTSRIFAYIDRLPTTIVYLEKHICYDPDKVETTDFFVTRLPVGAFDASATTTCRFISNNDDPANYEFTLTNMTTHLSQTAFWAGDPAYGFIVEDVPAGTYTLTETFGAGVYTATSEEFTVDPAANDQLVVVRNYTATPFEPEVRDHDAYFELRSFTCQNDTFETQYHYYFYPDGFGGSFQEDSVGNVGGAAAGVTENCHASEVEGYQFQLETDATGTGITAQATFALTPDPDAPSLYSSADLIPAGTYVIHELTTDSVTDPLVIGASTDGDGALNVADFYYYAAAPTPTATATSTVTPTPTATSPDDPTATATSPNDPTATPTLPGSTPPVATGTIPPDDGGVLPGRTPVATSASVGSGGNSGTGSDGTNGGVTTLPSTGQGQTGGDSTGMMLLLGLAISLLLAAALLARRKRRS